MKGVVAIRGSLFTLGVLFAGRVPLKWRICGDGAAASAEERTAGRADEPKFPHTGRMDDNGRWLLEAAFGAGMAVQRDGLHVGAVCVSRFTALSISLGRKGKDGQINTRGFRCIHIVIYSYI